jgi:hypothetical protein
MTLILDSWEEYSIEDTSCLICLSELNYQKENIVKLDCFHSHCFHKDCLYKTSIYCKNYNCPLCRVSYNKSIFDDYNHLHDYNNQLNQPNQPNQPNSVIYPFIFENNIEYDDDINNNTNNINYYNDDNYILNDDDYFEDYNDEFNNDYM